MDDLDSKNQEFVKIPKVELHAHLNGSLSQKTLKKLLDLKYKKQPDKSISLSSFYLSSKNLDECFKLFSLIHNLTDSHEALYIATCDVIKEFSDDNVRYLELRTTPKEIENCMTQESYVQTIIKAIKDTEIELNRKILVKLLLSLDRKRDIGHAKETLSIAEQFFISSQTVVGLDLSGDPTAGEISKFIPLLECAKNKGLNLSIHLSEVPGADEEVKQILKLYPHRLGHGSFLHPLKGGSIENFTFLEELKIPLEICLTSNVFCKTVPSYEDHHLKLLREKNYPYILCTDDKGIFNTTLSKEFSLASYYHKVTEGEFHQMFLDGINFAFCSQSEKATLQEISRIPKVVEQK